MDDRGNRDDREERDMDSDEEQDEARMQILREAFLARFIQQMLNPQDEDAGGMAGLVDRLKRSGALKNPAVEKAMLTIPRIAFLTDDLKDQAYMDHPLRFAKMGFNISAPHMYAVTLEHLNIEPGCSVLDIGSGCGYWTALAGYLAGPTGYAHGLDLHQFITDFAEQNVRKFCQENPQIDLSNVKFFTRNCFLPDPEERKYDRIHVGACCPESHLNYLIDLLNPNGILVTPFGDKLLKVVKTADGEIKTQELMPVRYSDLVLPSEAEIHKAQRELEKARALRIVVPPPTPVSDFSQHYNNEATADIAFIVQGKRIPAHKAILCKRSDVFRAMFEAHTKENSATEIPITDQDYASFSTIMQFIYTDNADLNSDNVVGVLELANYYKLDRLVALCEAKLKDMVDVENAAGILSLAERFNAPQLRKFVMEFIFANINAVMQTEGFKELDRDVMNSIILEAVKKQAF